MENVVLATQNDSQKTGEMRCVIAFGYHQQQVIDAVMYRAREILRKPENLSSSESSSAEEILPTWWETWADGLAYCTWNGLGRDLTEDRIVAAVQDLHDRGIKSSFNSCETT